MDSNTIRYIIIAIATISYLFDQLLDYINLKAQRTDIPADIADFYDKDRYLTSLKYHRELTQFSFITSAFSFILSIIILSLGGFGWLDSLLRGYFDNEIILALAFFGILMFASDVFTIPFQLYGTFVIEEKYGFNKTTLKTFFMDKLKGYFLAALIGAPLVSLLIYLIQVIGPNFWIWFSIVASIFILFMNMFYTSLILPLFNKLTPLPDSDLKRAIQDFASKVKFPLDNIFVIDGSKRSNKANAFFAGIGKKKKIVLYDTLIQKHSTEELVAVLAHEVGHFKKKHIVWGFVLSLIQVFFTMFILSLMVYNSNVSAALGAETLAIHVNLIAFTILFTPISGITGLLMSIYSRKNEFEADAYAKETYGGDALSVALKRLSVDSLSNLYPHPLYVFFHYSHPPLLQRLEALDK
ncbi:M48 family metallopeptidase [Chryseosolibacter indicus]|uniref:M48 family metallopeptidase n=1 Tax=Chryseosolibacter indicus TaxID=2782351 RepID=A0ABS5VQ49_9BACT|nr:M48 family metallopeptidase [Chryseosolibacter indicus]MBT1703558.1 M48 family metallopeptidase [Chryseosolibacter indicus]